MSSECHQSVVRVSSACLQSVFRVSSECVQSVFNIEVTSSSSASSVSIFGIFFTDFPHLHNFDCLERETFVFDVVDGW